MNITTLLENSTSSDRFKAKHGLSLFIQTQKHRIVFDMGPDGSFCDNAAKMDVDIASADIAFVSHGHYDHGGGLMRFLECNVSAPVFIQKTAFEQHVVNTPNGYKDIGLSPILQESGRFVYVDSYLEIDDELTLFSQVEARELVAQSNKVLLARHDEIVQSDSFSHEQSLLICEEGAYTLVTGCSHCGIVNIMKKAEGLVGAPLHAVVAGFHLMDPGTGAVEDLEVASQIGSFLKERPTQYYTFHCTGLAAYSVLRDILGDQVNYLYVGSRVEI